MVIAIFDRYVTAVVIIILGCTALCAACPNRHASCISIVIVIVSNISVIRVYGLMSSLPIIIVNVSVIFTAITIVITVIFTIAIVIVVIRTIAPGVRP